MFKNAEVGTSLLMPPINWLNQINAQKDFVLTVEGEERLTNWFAQTLMLSQSAGIKYGRKMGRGVTRYCNMTNGGRSSSTSRTARSSASSRSTSPTRTAPRGPSKPGA